MKVTRVASHSSRVNVLSTESCRKERETKRGLRKFRVTTKQRPKGQREGEKKVAGKLRRAARIHWGKHEQKGEVRAKASGESTFSRSTDSGKIHIDLSWLGTTLGPSICQLEKLERVTKYETCWEFFFFLGQGKSIERSWLKQTVGEQWFVDADK